MFRGKTKTTWQFFLYVGADPHLAYNICMEKQTVSLHKFADKRGGQGVIKNMWACVYF